eukprot:GEMP01019742.1.p1 GENE.GEMP01019742.1~~GEMP01019742.1.p1  ORF type:complete len:125 (-),score=21.94 GEMP01019742.1:2116-2490(-)
MVSRVNQKAFSGELNDDFAPHRENAKPRFRQVSSRTPLHCMMLVLGTFIFVFLISHAFVSCLLPAQKEMKPDLDIDWHSPEVKAEQRRHGMELYERMTKGEDLSVILEDPKFASKHFQIDFHGF